ncbi:hypothetical protein MVEN_01037400 [Mycena venus]|uniref:Uncharacterized protein n=1 Tax=Mycena venus TaxID=2733690 RepID=A0A8H6YC45_9AGAR|nr:hypothetical protein MVEN_01037400 [Mycena venus]
MTSASSSTTSLVSNTTASSRAPLTAAQSKDFQSAFASLQSTYGFSGTAPSPVQKETSSVPRPDAASPATHPTTKDFQSAFADLQSTYGFGGAVPSPVPKPKKQGNTSGSLFSKFTRSSKPQAAGFSTSTSAPKTKVRAVPRPTQHMVVL